MDIEKRGSGSTMLRFVTVTSIWKNLSLLCSLVLTTSNREERDLFGFPGVVAWSTNDAYDVNVGLKWFFFMFSCKDWGSKPCRFGAK